jgi:uncharacterized protein YkwD
MRPGKQIIVIALSVTVLLVVSVFSMVSSSSARGTLTSDRAIAATLTPMAWVYLPYMSRMASPTPTPTVTPSPTPPPQPGWLKYVNGYRAMAGLPSLVENSTWSSGCWLHARYIVKNDDLQHTEDPANPWYTLEGLFAAESSNLAGDGNVNASDEWAIDTWMQAPFHAVGILDPKLRATGFGSYREADGGIQMGAALDVIRGWGAIPPSVVYPIKWPGDGATVSLRLHWGEVPSPLTSCPGYAAPSGLPIILQIGSGERTPNVTAHSFTQGGAPLDHCVFDETNYTYPIGEWQDLARSLLDARDAIVLIPRAPLTSGATYTASITVNEETHTWSFTVSAAAQAQPIPGWQGVFDGSQ